MKRRQFLNYSARTGLAAVALNPFDLMAASDFKTGLVFDDSFKHHHIDPRHPESPERYFALKQQFLDSEVFSRTVEIKPLSDIEKWLKLVHSDEHINAIRQDAETHKNVSRATGGVLAAVDLVCLGELQNAFCASRPPGHHALNTGKEEGFCYYNHIAIAARYAQQKYSLKKILIIDWDYHHGNGTEATFYDDPSVLFFSTHDQFAYPGTGSPERTGAEAGYGYNINVHLGCGAGDTEIMQVFKSKLSPVVDRFKPELILISCGFDSRENDLLGCHKVTDAGFSELTTLVKMMADKHCDGRIISVLEGGYNVQGNALAAVAHIEALLGSVALVSLAFVPMIFPLSKSL